MDVMFLAETATPSITDTIGTLVTAGLSWVTSTANTVAGNPLLLTGVVIGFVGVGIGLFKRIIN